MPSARTATVDSFDASIATAGEVVSSLARNGGCFLRGFVDRNNLDTMIKEVQPYVDADVPWEGKFFPKETRRRFFDKTWQDAVLNKQQV